MRLVRVLLLISVGLSLGIGFLLWNLRPNLVIEGPSTEIKPLDTRVVKENVPLKVEMRHVIGNVDAPLDVKFFTSLTCAFCKEIHDTILPELAIYCAKNRRVKITLLPIPSDQVAADANYLLECAPPQHFPAIMKAVYDQQSALFSQGDKYLPTLENIGKLVGVTRENYTKCRADKDLKTRVLSVYLLMRKYGIDEAPTFVVGDKILLGDYTTPRLIEWIEFMLRTTVKE